jgi:aspartate/methionine/tyrosine aminotransferase
MLDLTPVLRDAARAAPESGIVAVANHGRGKAGLIPLWVGEGDKPTPDFISNAMKASIEAGETFYTWQRGIPDLRSALARYHTRHFGRQFDASEFIVTGGGMHAILLSLHATAGQGDEAIYLTPAWPNFPGAAGVAGAVPVAVPLEFSSNGWALDHQRLKAAITPKTKVIFFNSPSNPTGWTADRADLEAVLALARQHGIWIIADEIYARFHYDGNRAPSFVDIMQPEDRILFVNTFSKNWAMTGWRIGWITAHPSLQQVFENLVQYSTSGVATFMQRGAIAALDGGDPYLNDQIEHARQARDMVCSVLGRTGRTRFAVPAGAFYLFFSIDQVRDSKSAALRMIDDVQVGLAPGSAFGPGGEGFFRLCFHRGIDGLEEAALRIAGWIKRL